MSGFNRRERIFVRRLEARVILLGHDCASESLVAIATNDTTENIELDSV